MLEGRLVNLRAAEMEDLESYWRWINDREVTRFLSTQYPWSLVKERDWLEAALRRGNDFRHAGWTIETKDGRPIGTIGISTRSPENRDGELGIFIGEKDCWSQGYGTDAVRTLLRFAFETMNLRKVELSTPEFNGRAQACYRKCGFVEEGRRRKHLCSDGEYYDSVIMGILREEWAAMQPKEAAND